MGYDAILLYIHGIRLQDGPRMKDGPRRYELNFPSTKLTNTTMTGT